MADEAAGAVYSFAGMVYRRDRWCLAKHHSRSGRGGSTEQIYATSTLALAVVSIYFFLLWFLKPAIVPRHENFQVARRLTAPQKSKLKQALIGQFVTDNFALIRDNSSRKALIFAQDFDEVFTSSGWNVGQAGLSGVAQFPPSGIGMVIRDTANIGANMKTVMAALDAAGIPFDIMTDLPAPVGDGLYVTDPE